MVRTVPIRTEPDEGASQRRAQARIMPAVACRIAARRRRAHLVRQLERVEDCQAALPRRRTHPSCERGRASRGERRGSADFRGPLMRLPAPRRRPLVRALVFRLAMPAHPLGARLEALRPIVVELA